MSKKKNYIKFYSKLDLSSGYYLEKAQVVLDNFKRNTYLNSKDVNSIIELYNIKQYFDNEIFLTNWTSEKIKSYKSVVSSFDSVIGKFLSKLNDTNIENILNAVDNDYKDDFWFLFDKYKLYSRISNACLEKAINNNNDNIVSILIHKGIVSKYDTEITSFLRTWDLTGRIVVENYFSSHTGGYFFPTSFKDNDFDDALNRYIDSINCSMKHLELIYKSSSYLLRINNSTKLKAKQKYDKMRDDFFKDNNVTVAKFSVSIKYDEGFSESIEDGKYSCVYDKKWFDNNLDYPTILNNFMHLYNYWDECWRISLVSKDYETGVVERIGSNNGDKWYLENHAFEFRKMKSSAELQYNYLYLKEKGIDLCNVLEWFFSEYLLQEFKANGFEFNAPSIGTSFLEKNKLLLSELDGVLKQFKLFVENGTINRELFELYTEQCKIKSIPSFIENKYVYSNSNDINNAATILFHDSSLAIFSSEKSDYDCLCTFFLKENVDIKKMNDNQLNYLSCLKKIDAITVIGGKVKLNRDVAIILKDIYFNEVLCLSYYKEYTSIVDEMIKNGHLRAESTLFSIPEQKYLNYMLNKNEFTNGPELRNKYIHSNYSRDTTTQEEDFIEILKIVVLVIGKINEEFILRDEQKCCTE